MLSTHYFPHVGGAEKQVERLSRWLVDHETPVMIVTRAVTGYPDHENDRGVEIYRVPVLPGKIPSALSFILLSLWVMWRQRRRFQVIHSHQIFSPTTIGWFAARLLRRPLIVNLHRGGPEGDLDKILHKPTGKLRLRILRHDTHAFVAISQEIVHELEQEGIPRHKIHILFNAVDPAEFSPAHDSQRCALRQKLHLEPDTPLVIFAGRLVPEKGLTVLIEAWKQVSEPAQLLILGSGPLEAALLQQIDQGEVQRVALMGQKDNVADYLRASDIWTLPSYTEGLPVSLLEAMACGLPVVTTPVGGIPDVVAHDEQGLLVPAGNAERLAQALNTLLSDPKARRHMGQKARAAVLERYRIDRVAEQYQQLYQDVLKPQPR